MFSLKDVRSVFEQLMERLEQLRSSILAASVVHGRDNVAKDFESVPFVLGGKRKVSLFWTFTCCFENGFFKKWIHYFLTKRLVKFE